MPKVKRSIQEDREEFLRFNHETKTDDRQPITDDTNKMESEI